jgi:hypothetical protein
MPASSARHGLPPVPRPRTRRAEHHASGPPNFGPVDPYPDLLTHTPAAQTGRGFGREYVVGRGSGSRVGRDSEGRRLVEL